MQEVFLLNLKINGVKNIEKEMSFDFYKSSLANFNSENYKLKGIFGRNGIGKTAVIKAVEIIQNLVVFDDYIYTDKEFPSLINQQKKECFIELEFLVKENGKFKIFSHSVTIKNEKDNIYIASENIYLKTKTKKIIKSIEIVNGEIINNTLIKDHELLVNITKNLLKKTSIISLIQKYDIFVNEDEKSPFDALSPVITFYYSLNIYTGYSKFTNAERECLKDFFNDDDFIELEKTIKKRTEFIKKFIPDLTNIMIEKTESPTKYYFNYKFVHNNNTVIDYEYESKGIQKLFEFFDYIEIAYQGEIVLIDEIDLCLHDVYLTKIIEFLGKMGHGQFIFTAHNIGLLDLLKEFKQSIDFITEKQEVFKWKKNGNYSPRIQYKEGLLENMPFNIDYYDFYELFRDDENEEL